MLAAEDKIANYIRKRIDRLCYFDADIENRLWNDGQDFINKCDDDRACNEHLWHIETVMRSTFRYTMLIAICTFLEESVKFLCHRSVADYEKKLDAYRRNRKGWLAKHRQLLADNTQVGLAAVKADLDKMEDFVVVRNCVVHGWGKVNGKVARIIEIDEKKGGDCCFGKSEDGFLLVTDQAFPTAAIASDRIVRKLLQDLGH